MKKVLYTVALAAFVMVTGCKKEEDSQKIYICRCSLYENGVYVIELGTSGFRANNAADAETICSENEYVLGHSSVVCGIVEVF